MKNKKGFTLIELLAVIVILGILMMAAIPAITRTIAKSRRNTFWQNAKSYVKAATTPFLSGEYEVKTAGSNSGLTAGDECPLPGKGKYVAIPLTEVELEQGDKNKSSFNALYTTTGNCVPHIIVANIETDQAKADNIQWYFVGMDQAKNGITNYTNINNLKLGVVKTGATCAATAPGNPLTLDDQSVTYFATCKNANN